MLDVCELCGDELHINDWPFCNGIKGKHVQVECFGEEPLESYIDHNVSPDPHGVLITSRGQRRQLMRENGLEYKKKRTDMSPNRRLYFDMSK